MKKLREKINNFLYPLTTSKAIAAVFGFGILLWAIGLGINLFDPTYDYTNPGDLWYPGYTVILIGALFFIAHFVLRVIGLWVEKPAQEVGAKGLLSSEKSVNAIDKIADTLGLWGLPVAVAMHVGGIYGGIPIIEAAGGILIVLTAGMLGWKYLFRVK